MSYLKTRKKSKKVLILIAPHFDEELVIQCLCKMRDKNIDTSLIGSMTGLLRGFHGLRIDIDNSLTQMEKATFTSEHVLIIPGSYESVTRLLTDPRTHNLIKRIIEANGLIVTTSSAQEAIAKSMLPIPELDTLLLQQNNQDTTDFISKILNFIL